MTGRLASLRCKVRRYMLSARGGGNVALMFLQHPLDVFPLQPFHRRRLRAGQNISACVVAERRHDFIGIRRFRQILGCAQLDRCHRRGNAGIASQHHNTRSRIESAQGLE